MLDIYFIQMFLLNSRLTRSFLIQAIQFYKRARLSPMHLSVFLEKKNSPSGIIQKVGSQEDAKLVARKGGNPPSR